MNNKCKIILKNFINIIIILNNINIIKKILIIKIKASKIDIKDTHFVLKKNLDVNPIYIGIYEMT